MYGGIAIFQQTIARPVTCRGPALHLGREIELTLYPGPVDSGLVFRRADLPGRPAVRATVANVVDTRRCMTIGTDGWRISTIEHLAAAAHGAGIDNLLIEVDGEELPVGDGSALFFMDLLNRAGLAGQEKPRRVWQVSTPVWVAENDSYLIVLPPGRPCLSISYTFCADKRAIGSQHHQFHLGEDDFAREIAPARTIAFLEEIEALRREGLAQSTDTDVVVVVGPDGYLNSLRLPDEIVRHKILDLLGDLYLFGRLYGRIVAVRSGHRLNHRLGQELCRSAFLAAPAAVAGEAEGQKS